MAAEREADDICLAFLLERELGEHGWDEKFEGEVNGVIGAGVFVSFRWGGIAAPARASSRCAASAGDWYDMNEQRTMLVGRESGRRLRLGDPVRCGCARSTHRAAGSTWSRREQEVKGSKSRPTATIAVNRQARFRYHLLETFEAGIALTGSEVKSARESKVNLKDSYALVRDQEVWLHNCHIAPYGPAAGQNHEPERPRKLLLHKRRSCG